MVKAALGQVPPFLLKKLKINESFKLAIPFHSTCSYHTSTYRGAREVHPEGNTMPDTEPWLLLSPSLPSSWAAECSVPSGE